MPVTIGKRIESDFADPLGLLSDCHRRIEQFLDVLIRVTEEARGAALNEDQRYAVDVSLRYFREAAPKHTQDEEESLFPRMMSSGNERARSAISLLERLHADHERADAAHARVEALAGEWLSSGSLAKESIALLSELLNELRAIYEKHIQIEDQQVFPIAGQVLSDDELLAVGCEMAARRSVHLSGLGSRSESAVSGRRS